jgi:hypothetical protein
MEPDLSPRLEGCSAVATVGTEGVRLTLETTGCSQPFEVFLTPSEAKRVAACISPPPGTTPTGRVSGGANSEKG